MHTISYSTHKSLFSHAATNSHTQKSHVASQLKRITFTTAKFILDGLQRAIVKSEHDLAACRIARKHIANTINKISGVDGFKEKAEEALKIIDKNIEKNLEKNKNSGHFVTMDIVTIKRAWYLDHIQNHTL